MSADYCRAPPRAPSPPFSLDRRTRTHITQQLESKMSPIPLLFPFTSTLPSCMMSADIWSRTRATRPSPRNGTRRPRDCTHRQSPCSGEMEERKGTGGGTGRRGRGIERKERRAGGRACPRVFVSVPERPSCKQRPRDPTLSVSAPVLSSCVCVCVCFTPTFPTLVRVGAFAREEAPHTLFGNRAAARLGLGRPQEALEDAEVRCRRDVWMERTAHELDGNVNEDEHLRAYNTTPLFLDHTRVYIRERTLPALRVLSRKNMILQYSGPRRFWARAPRQAGNSAGGVHAWLFGLICASTPY